MARGISPTISLKRHKLEPLGPEAEADEPKLDFDDEFEPVVAKTIEPEVKAEEPVTETARLQVDEKFMGLSPEVKREAERALEELLQEGKLAASQFEAPTSTTTTTTPVLERAERDQAVKRPVRVVFKAPGPSLGGGNYDDITTKESGFSTYGARVTSIRRIPGGIFVEMNGKFFEVPDVSIGSIEYE